MFIYNIRCAFTGTVSTSGIFTCLGLSLTIGSALSRFMGACLGLSSAGSHALKSNAEKTAVSLFLLAAFSTFLVTLGELTR